MVLTSHRKHKIYIAATMGYSLGSDDREEVDFYTKIKEELKENNKNRNMGINRRD